jgi:hypothetical protein
MKMAASNVPDTLKPHAVPASTGKIEAGKNFGRVACNKRLATCPGAPPVKSSGTGLLIGTGFEGMSRAPALHNNGLCVMNSVFYTGVVHKCIALETTDSRRAVLVLFVKPEEAPQDEDAPDDHDCGQWQMVPADELMAKLRRNSFIAGKYVGARDAGNRQQHS